MKTNKFFALAAAMFSACSEIQISTDDSQESIVTAGSGQLSGEFDSTTDTTVNTNSQNNSNELTSVNNEYNSESMFTERDLSGEYEQASAVKISCSDKGFTVDGAGVSVKDNVLSISSEGVYILSGSISDGRIVIDTDDKSKVQLVLNGVSIKCSNHSPLYVKSADKVFITLADGAENVITDSGNYSALKDDENNVDSAIFSKSDLTFNGSGSLTVKGNMSHAIVSKDDLVVAGGTLIVTSACSAVCGKDSVRVADGSINITSGGDGIKTSNTEEKGFIYFEGGSINITAETDGIQASSDLVLNGGSLNITSGGGSANSSFESIGQNDMSGGWGMWGGENLTDSEETASAKGLKADGQLIVQNTIITADTSDDSIHAAGNVEIISGTMEISSGDDGIHSDSSTIINGGLINIAKSYEGIEGKSVEINGGDIDIVAYDDGINAAGGNDNYGMHRPGMNTFAESSDCYIKINAGEVYINAEGDGIDSNAGITISGGLVYVDGPTSGGNAALDSDFGVVVNGGEIVAVGSSSMAEACSESSSQCCILYNFANSYSKSDKVILKDADGNVILEFSPSKSFNSVNLSASGIESGKKYTLTVGNDSVEIEMTSQVYSNGNFGGMGGDFGGMGGGPNGRFGGRM